MNARKRVLRRMLHVADFLRNLPPGGDEVGSGVEDCERKVEVTPHAEVGARCIVYGRISAGEMTSRMIRLLWE